MFIFSGSNGQASKYRMEHGMNTEEYPFIVSALTVSGHKGVEHVRIGDWFDRSDVEQIVGALDYIRSEEVTAV
jgi:hypothetical protein